MQSILAEHIDYLSDRIRVEQFEAAIEKIVRPGHIVLDLGCGTGILGLMALRAGAGKVYFVDEGPVIEAARHTIAEAGFASSAEFYQSSSFEISLPKLADIVVCDHIGCFGFDYNILSTLADAKRRFLRPGGTLLPAELEVKLAPVESDENYSKVLEWRDGTVPHDFRWLSTFAANTKFIGGVSAENLLAPPKSLATLQPGDLVEDYMSWSASFEISRDGRISGLSGWFNSRLVDDVWLTNAPDQERVSHRRQAFLPMETPTRVKAGERIDVTIMTRHEDNIIGWVVELPGRGERYCHSTFNAILLDDEAMTRARTDRVARLNERGRARQIVLGYCDGNRTVAEVQAIVQRDHPGLFPSEHAASTFVMQVLSRDTSE